jgi:ethanolamine utilization protein EutN
MQICRVIGAAVATVKQESLRGLKLLLVQPATVEDELRGEPFVAADTVGAGTGELVVVATGSAARETPHTRGAPVSAAIVAILDSLEVGGRVTFRKS